MEFGIVPAVLGWAVPKLLDQVLKYVGQANACVDSAKELEQLLLQIKPLVSIALQNDSESEVGNRPAKEVVENWLRELHPLLQGAEDVLKRALDWMEACRLEDQALHIREKRMWSQAILKQTERIRKMAVDHGPFANLASTFATYRAIMGVKLQMEGFRDDVTTIFRDNLAQKNETLMLQAEESIKRALSEELDKPGSPDLVVSFCQEAKHAIGARITTEMAKVRAWQGEHIRYSRHAASRSFADITEAAHAKRDGLERFSFETIRASVGNFTAPIAEGGHGRTFLGTLQDGRKVAVKAFKDQDPFVNELEMSCICVHEHVVKFYGYCIEGMEIQSDDKLRRRLQRHRRLTESLGLQASQSVKGGGIRYHKKLPSHFSFRWFKKLLSRRHERMLCPAPSVNDTVLLHEAEAVEDGSGDPQSCATSEEDWKDLKFSGVMCLVFEYMENQDLNGVIFRAPQCCPNWSARLNIAVGIAKGLVYLHDSLGMVHRDIKPSNILLGSDFWPKIGDMGVSKLLRTGSSTVDYDDQRSEQLTEVVGSLGFVDPDTVMTGMVTVKSDMYSFGVTLMVMVTGRKAVDRERQRGEQFLAHWVQQTKDVSDVVDKRMGTLSTAEKKQAKTVLDIAGMCITYDSASRLAAKNALSMLLRARSGEA